VATASVGKIVQSTLTPNPRIDGFRATIDIALLPGQSTDLQIHLKAGSRTVTETWAYPIGTN
jgi:glucans biosynthesis protein